MIFKMRTPYIVNLLKKWNFLGSSSVSSSFASFRRYICTSKIRKCDVSDDDESFTTYDSDSNELASESELTKVTSALFNITEMHSCYVVHPHIKVGPKKKTKITPEEEIDEAVALIQSLPRWRVIETEKISVDTTKLATVFKSGSLSRLQHTVKSDSRITALFINVSLLKLYQIEELQNAFGMPVFDRYKIVIKILKLHATTHHAKLQVALAELHYLVANNEMNDLILTKDPDKINKIINTKRKRLRVAITDLRRERSEKRNVRRQTTECPSIAVIGYTNCGKTSIIKALTGAKELQPRNQLFATLDVTVHEGLMPTGLKVHYIDTVGFLSEIPTDLIECFIATLEDAILADIILVVEDLSHSCFQYQRDHVFQTLKQLSKSMEIDTNFMDRIISVGNKSDLMPDLLEYDGTLKVSAKTGYGLNKLRQQLEDCILLTTDRKRLKIKIRTGSEELRWLYKNTTIIEQNVDESNEFVTVNVIITCARLNQFKHNYIKKRANV